jgi:alpha-1,6-mannosyltransferase
MRIAQLANFIGPASGGMKTAVDRLGRGYVEAGAQRLLVVPGPRDSRVATEHGDVVQVRAPQVGGGYRLIVEPWRVVDVLEEFAPTSLEISDKSTLLPVARWARRNGVDTILFSHERLDAMLSLRTGRERGIAPSVGVLNRILVRQFDRVVVTSRFAMREFRHVAAAAGTALHHIPLGVDLATFRPPEAPPVRDDVLRLIHVGRLSREKSPHLAVATAVDLHQRGVPVRLDVYGTGPHRDELEEIADGAPVVFHGHVAGRDELADRIGAADIALSVCPGETFGLAVLEALACGTPVVTAAYGGARELVDERCGAWAEPDPASLGDAVLELASRPVDECRAAARARAEQFCWTSTVREMVALHAERASATGAFSSWLQDWASRRPDRPGQGRHRPHHQRRGDPDRHRHPLERGVQRGGQPERGRQPHEHSQTAAVETAGADDRQAPQGVPRVDDRAQQHRGGEHQGGGADGSARGARRPVECDRGRDPEREQDTDGLGVWDRGSIIAVTDSGVCTMVGTSRAPSHP